MLNQRDVECTNCERWTHVVSGGISVADYKWMSDQEEKPWFSLDCQPTTDTSLTSIDGSFIFETNGRDPFKTGCSYLTS